MIQSVIEYDLERFGTGPGQYDFAEADRHLTHQFEQLEPGTMVRLKVHTYKPIPGYPHCRRTDIMLQVISEDVEAFRAWHAVFQPEATLDY